ncbi:hypothetical protein NGRA_3411, partial [Nosema granulosis]
VLDKKRKEILIVEVGITNQDLLTVVENEKLRKYNLLANELGLMYKAKTKILPYVITWDGMVTGYHKKHIHELGSNRPWKLTSSRLCLRRLWRVSLWSEDEYSIRTKPVRKKWRDQWRNW